VPFAGFPSIAATRCQLNQHNSNKVLLLPHSPASRQELLPDQLEPTGAGAPFSTILMLQPEEESVPRLDVVNPALHGRHLLLPSVVLYVPSGQSKQACDLPAGVYCPAGHSMHSVEPYM
jgi:hypothetical protein